MKPHEETLHYASSGVHGGYVVHTETADDAAIVGKDYGRFGPLWAAAPEMARALVIALQRSKEGRTLDAHEDELIEAALSKAGVL